LRRRSGSYERAEGAGNNGPSTDLGQRSRRNAAAGVFVRCAGEIESHKRGAPLRSPSTPRRPSVTGVTTSREGVSVRTTDQRNVMSPRQRPLRGNEVDEPDVSKIPPACLVPRTKGAEFRHVDDNPARLLSASAAVAPNRVPPPTAQPPTPPSGSVPNRLRWFRGAGCPTRDARPTRSSALGHGTREDESVPRFTKATACGCQARTCERGPRKRRP
jgi:hypothetical protein